jgi:hypothetical protein
LNKQRAKNRSTVSAGRNEEPQVCWFILFLNFLKNNKSIFIVYREKRSPLVVRALLRRELAQSWDVKRHVTNLLRKIGKAFY